MRPARRRPLLLAALSALLHLAVLGGLALREPRLPAPEAQPGGPPVPIIPILLAPRDLPARDASAATPSGAIRLHRRDVRARDLPATVAPLLSPQAQPSVRPVRAAPGPSEPGPDVAQGQATDLTRALRRSVGCGNAEAYGLSRAERALCEERLGRGATSTPYIPAPIEPAKRTYYDAVAEARAPAGPPTPSRAPGALGQFDTDMRGTKGHGPAIGCKLKFGPGKPQKGGPPHALNLGPCYIAPPAGSLTPDVDIAPP